MPIITVTRRIDAPAEVVFRAISDIANRPETVPGIVGVEFLSETRSGVGTRFRETRLVKRKEAKRDLELTEYVLNDNVRMVADSHGTVWDTRFTVRSAEGHSDLEIEMNARAHKLLPRLLNPIKAGLFRRGVEKHMQAVAAYCESQPR